MIPKKFDLYCYSGQTWSQNITFKQNGKPINLTGAIANAQVRPELNSKKLLADMLCVIERTSGKISLNLSAEQTSELKPGTYRYDLKVTKGNDVQYYICGDFIVTGRVTE